MTASLSQRCASRASRVALAALRRSASNTGTTASARNTDRPSKRLTTMRWRHCVQRREVSGGGSRTTPQDGQEAGKVTAFALPRLAAGLACVVGALACVEGTLAAAGLGVAAGDLV